MARKTGSFGSGPKFFKVTVSDESLKCSLNSVRTIVPKATIHDLLVSSLTLAIEQELKDQISKGQVYGGSEFISIMTPIDLRAKSGSFPLIANLSATPSVTTDSKVRSNPIRLLEYVNHDQARNSVARAKVAIGALELLDLLGVYKSAREVKLRTGMPRRSEVDGEKFWKFMDTAMITYVGRVKPPLRLRAWVTEYMGFPPVIPPWGLSVTAASGNGELVLGIPVSETTLSVERARIIIQNLIQKLEDYGNQPAATN